MFLFAGFALRAIGWTEGLRSGAGEGILVRPILGKNTLAGNLLEIGSCLPVCSPNMVTIHGFNGHISYNTM